jgi:hypothetical protein
MYFQIISRCLHGIDVKMSTRWEGFVLSYRNTARVTRLFPYFDVTNCTFLKQGQTTENRRRYYKSCNRWSLRIQKASLVLVARSNFILQHSTTQPLTNYFYVHILWYTPIWVAMLTTTKVCGRSATGIASSNTADGMVVSGLLCAMLVISSERSRSLVQGTPAGFVCVRVIVCDPEISTMMRPGRELGCYIRGKKD